MDRVQQADPPCRALSPPQRLTTATAITIVSTPSLSTTSSASSTSSALSSCSSPSSSSGTTAVAQEILDCAICLDNIRPKHHAKAILACRHEFHLSCISMAFSLGKEMICPLCRFLHKEQPFMYSEDEATKPLAALSTQASGSQTSAASPPTSSTATVSSGRNRNRNNSIHLQHNLSNLVQHQQRRRGSTYDLRRGSVSSLPSPTTPTATGLMNLSGAPQPREERTGLLSMIPFLGSLGSSGNSTLSHTPHRQLSSSLAPSNYLSTSVWFMLYGLPFSVAILFLAFILGQVETLWSKVSCLIGSVICYMVCWAIVVAFLVPTHHAIHLPYPDELSVTGSPATTASSMVMAGAATMATAVGATTAAAMEYEFDVVDAFTEDVGQSHVLGITTRPTVDHSQGYNHQQQQPQQQQQQSQEQQQQHPDDILVSSVSMFSWMTPGICSLSRWLLTSPYAQDLQSRMTDLVEILDDYSESFGGW